MYGDDDDDVFRDEDLAGTLSQLQGRPSLRLDSLLTTPPTTTGTPFMSRDLNVLTDLKFQEQRQLRRCTIATARTAPSSPTQPRLRAHPPQRPLTPTLTAALPAFFSTTVAPRCHRAMKGDVDSILDDANSCVGNSCASIHGNLVNPEGDMSLLPSSRWVSFSFASGLTSRRHSEGHLSSRSLSPQPRAAIIPSRFPNLHFSDDEGTGRAFRSLSPLPLFSARSMMTNECIHGSLECLPHKERHEPRLSVDSAAVTAENTVVVEHKGFYREGRVSVLLTSAAAPCEVAEATNPESEGSQARCSHGKRGRSCPMSPLPVSFLICDRDSSTHTIVELDGEPGEVRVSNGAKRQRVDEHQAFLEKNKDILVLDEDHAHNICVDTSRSVPQEDKSLVLVSGPTPTPWRRRLAGAENKTQSTERGDGREEEEEEEKGGKTVADVRCSDTLTTSSATLFEGGAWGAMGCERDTLNVINDGDLCTIASPEDHRTNMTIAQAESETLIDKIPRGSEGGFISDVGEYSVTATTMCHRGDDMRALIRNVREELHRTSEQLVAVLESQYCRSSLGSRDSNNNLMDEDPKDAERSVRLSFGRSSALMGGAEDPVREKQCGDKTEKWGISVSPKTSVLRRELATHADRILRRLRGYDAADAGTLPMRMVIHVVRQTLAGVVGADGTPVLDGEDELDLSWGAIFPLPLSVVQHAASTAASTGASPTAACRSTWEKATRRRRNFTAEENVMRLYMSLWRCFRERFGVRHAAKRIGFLGDNSSDHAMTTFFPYLRQQLFMELEEKGQKEQQQPSSPLDTIIDYTIFAAGLSELN